MDERGVADAPGAFSAALAEAEAFFMGGGRVRDALTTLVARLDTLGIPYAIVGAMALNAHGYRRTTEDVDVLLAPAGLARLKAEWLGRGYVERFPGSRGLRDAAARVDVDVVLTGDFPGDGQPKPVAFPDPADAAEPRDGVQVARLPVLITLKLASGISAPHRLRDLADVLELIRLHDLPPSYADDLDPYVQPEFRKLWQAAQRAEDQEEA